MRRTIDIELEYQGLIDKPPTSYGDPYKNACAGDQLTVDTWRDLWIGNYEAAKQRFGNLGEKSYGQLHGINRHKPAIVIGSGPSLKNAIPALKENAKQPYPILTVSCLHNFGYFEDEGCHSDYYLTLDGQDIVCQDVYEGRQKDPEHYWQATKGKKLLANIATPPALFDKWQGEVYLFNCLMPDMGIREAFKRIEPFNHYISSGGNALGGCLYSAKAVMGSCEIIIVGGDFCFDYDHTWHAYPTSYDNVKGNGIGNVIPWPDVYGIRRATWPSYWNFAQWMNWVSLNIPGRWCSASEGILGAYPEGNLSSFKYGQLTSLLEPYHIADTIQLGEYEFKEGKMVYKTDEKGAMIKTPRALAELWKDPQQPMEITLF